MNRLLIALFALLQLAFVGCCGPCRSYQRLQRPLVDTEWQLQQLNGRDIAPEGELFTLRFTAVGDLQGMAACNRLMGRYSRGEGRELAITSLATTRRLCPDKREGELLEALERVTHYDMDGPMLLLLSEGSLVAIFQSRTEPK